MRASSKIDAIAKWNRRENARDTRDVRLYRLTSATRTTRANGRVNCTTRTLNSSYCLNFSTSPHLVSRRRIADFFSLLLDSCCAQRPYKSSALGTYRHLTNRFLFITSLMFPIVRSCEWRMCI